MYPRFVLGLLALVTLCSCETSSDPRMHARTAKIRQEATGDFYMGRRYWVKGSRTWGWIRKPRQQWAKARLVVMNERHKKVPDRLPEYQNSGRLTNGYDHNVEYQIRGYYSGDEVYDPTTNLVVPEFVLQDYRVVDQSPGWLFSPNDRMGNGRLPRTHVMVLSE